MNDKMRGDIYDANRWGLPAEAIADLGNRLQGFWERFRDHFKQDPQCGWTWVDLSARAFVDENGT